MKRGTAWAGWALKFMQGCTIASQERLYGGFEWKRVRNKLLSSLDILFVAVGSRKPRSCHPDFKFASQLDDVF
jgi:hypothetical protein